jgi:hypothetical protein
MERERSGYQLNLLLLIVALGVAIPLTCVMILNITIKLVSGDNYNLDLAKLFKIYVGALVAWAVVAQVVQWGWK